MKKTIVVLVVIIIAAGAVYAYLSMNKSGSGPASVSQESNSMMKTSLRALLARGDDYTCTFSNQDEQGQMSGTVYIADSKMRGNFDLVTEQGVASQMSTIQDGTYVYSWGSAMGGEGIKMKMDQADQNVNDDNTNQNNSINPDQEYSYDCQPWQVDASFFVPPSDVNFRDFSAAAMPVVNQPVTVDELDCSVCDQAPGPEAQAQCRQALGC